MKRIDELTITTAAETLGDDSVSAELALDAFREEQPLLLAYLMSENFEALTLREQEFMLFITLVIWTAVKSESTEITEVDPDQLSEAEEHNWALLEASDKRMFHERLDVFFEDSPEEEILAFLEDALSDEEDGLSTHVGREAMFVSLKSISDCLLSSSNPA